MSALLTLLMEKIGHSESKTVGRKRLELVEIKNYLDEYYRESYGIIYQRSNYINEYYPTKSFKETCGSAMNSCVITKRNSWAA